MSLVHGRELSHDECRQSRRAFVHRRTLRDPPAACLPLPLLRGQMVPVILSPEESQTLALANAMGESLGACACVYMFDSVAAKCADTERFVL